MAPQRKYVVQSGFYGETARWIDQGEYSDRNAAELAACGLGDARVVYHDERQNYCITAYIAGGVVYSTSEPDSEEV